MASSIRMVTNAYPAVKASGSSQPLTRLYISKDETLYDAGQLYRTLRSSITDNYPLAGVLIPESLPKMIAPRPS